MIAPTIIAAPNNHRATGKAVLDTVRQQIEGAQGDPDRIAGALDALSTELEALRAHVSVYEWEAFVAEECRSHPLRHVLHQDPFTHRAFAKSRGYPGDAVTLDYLVGQSVRHAFALAESTPVGRHIHRYTVNRPTGAAVRARRDRISRVMDGLARARGSINVCAIACGHLREAERCPALHEGLIDRLIGLDHDIRSLEVVEEELSHLPVEPLHASVGAVVRKRVEIAPMDLVYAAGVYNYMSDRFAQRLTSRLFQLLKPGGELLIANGLPGGPDRALMEAFMDWWLIYRTEQEIHSRLSVMLPEEQIASVQYSTDEFGVFGFLSVKKAE